MIEQLGIRIEAVRVGYFVRGEFTLALPDGESIAWVGVWAKPHGRGWQAVWTETGKGPNDPASPIWPAIGLGRNLANVLACPLIAPQF